MLFVVVGDDRTRIRSRVGQIVDQYVPGELAALNLVELDGSSIGLVELQEIAGTLPFMGEHRVVVVRGLLTRFGAQDTDDQDELRDPKGEAATLKQVLSAIPDTTVLILEDVRKLSKTALSRLLPPNATIERFEIPGADELPAYIVALFAEHGVRIDREGLDLLASAVASDPARMGSETDKLIAYAGESGTLTARDVRQLVDIPADVAIWDVTDAIHSRDSSRALAQLRILLADGQPPQQLLGALASQIRNLVLAEDFRGASPDRLAAATGMKPYPARKTLQAVQRYRTGEPLRMLRALLDVDMRVKTGRAEMSSALEMFVVQACLRRL